MVEREGKPRRDWASAAETERYELTTQEEPYLWLNTCFLVGGGEIDEERED